MRLMRIVIGIASVLLLAGCGHQAVTTSTKQPTQYTASTSPQIEAQEARELVDVTAIAETNYQAAHHTYSNNLTTLLASLPPRYKSYKTLATRHTVQLGSSTKAFQITVYADTGLKGNYFRYYFNGSMTALTCQGTKSTDCVNGHWTGVGKTAS